MVCYITTREQVAFYIINCKYCSTKSSVQNLYENDVTFLNEFATIISRTFLSYEFSNEERKKLSM